MVFMLIYSLITRDYSICLLRESLISNKGGGKNCSEIMT